MSHRTTLILGTAGHIDHGKTALIKALTGIDTDRLPQEKERGITIDIGFAHLDLGEFRLGVIDVPGHERFIRNMLAGASGIDLALLVVAADDSIMPQTREHLAILELLKIRRGLIALTKCDLSEDGWLDLVEDELRELVRETFLENAPIVRTSAIQGSGLNELKAALREMCGHVASPSPRPSPGGREGQNDASSYEPFRLAVDRSFVAQGVGTVVTGTVNSGTLSIGDTVEWMPVAKSLRVRGVQSHGREVERVLRGERAAINLMGVHHTEIERGHVLASPGFLKASRLMTVRLRVLPESPWPIRHRERLRLHIGTAEIMAGVRLFEDAVVNQGETALGQLILAQPTTAVADQPFVLRAESPLVTLGGGHVLQPVGSRIRRGDRSVIERLKGLESDDPIARTETVIFFCGPNAWNELDICRDANVPPSQVDSIIAELRGRTALVEIESALGQTIRIHRDVLASVEDRIARSLRRLHDQSPLDVTVPRQRVSRQLNWLADEPILQAMMDRMIQEDRLAGDPQNVALPDFQPRLSEAQRDMLRRIESILEEAGFSPPDLKEISGQVGRPERDVRPILDLAVQAGRLVHLGGPLYMHAGREKVLRALMAETLSKTSSLAVSEIRDLLGTSRKYAVPICEYLDRIGVTKRVGDVRVPAGG